MSRLESPRTFEFKPRETPLSEVRDLTVRHRAERGPFSSCWSPWRSSADERCPSSSRSLEHREVE